VTRALDVNGVALFVYNFAPHGESWFVLLLALALGMLVSSQKGYEFCRREERSRMSEQPMDAKTKFILVNVSLLAGFTLSYFIGQPLFIIFITAVLLFSVANILMYRNYKKNRLG
jgi:hypothetical protein